MQSLKKTLIYQVITLGLSLGLMVSAGAADFATTKRLAELGNDAVSQTYLGLKYESGTGVRQDYDNAFYWYQKAANQGYANAQNNLARLYLEGNGVRQDYEKALNLFRSACDNGSQGGCINYRRLK